MTKKSAGRLQRDAEKKATEKMLKDPNADLISWDDLEKIYSENINMLITANTNMADIYKTAGIITNVPNKKGTADHIRGLAKDIRFFGEELSKIHTDHVGKTGIVKDTDETISAIKIYEGYIHWQQEYHSVIIPTITFLAEQAGLAAEEIAKAANALDTNVVTDVQAKEVKPTDTVIEPVAEIQAITPIVD